MFVTISVATGNAVGLRPACCAKWTVVIAVEMAFVTMASQVVVVPTTVACALDAVLGRTALWAIKILPAERMLGHVLIVLCLGKVAKKAHVSMSVEMVFVGGKRGATIANKIVAFVLEM